MKGTIKFTSTKFGPSIMWVDENNPQGRWFKVSNDAANFMRKGEAEIDMDNNNIVTKIVSSTLSFSGETKAPIEKGTGEISRASSYNADREKMIIRQSCLKAAVETISFQDPDKRSLNIILSVAETYENWVNRPEAKNE